MSDAFSWKEEYSVGVKEIDDQHKKLIKIINKLFVSLNNLESHKVLKDVLNDLVDFAGYHFDTEEKYFKKFNYKGAREHIKEHRAFTKKIKKFQKQYHNNEVEISFELIDYLEDWLLGHLESMDHKYIECFKKHGLK